MALMGAALSDISSNARLKVYPATEVLQVSNAPIFRAPGWEPQKRSYDVPAKGKGKDPERALEVSRARARAAVRDIALCNQFDYFITWTLDGSLINRYDADEVKRRVLTFLKTRSTAMASPMSSFRSFTRMVQSTFMACASWEPCGWNVP